MPVKAYFLYHFIMAAALINAVYCIYKYQYVENNARRYVATMETGNSKEVVKEVVGRPHSRLGIIVQYILNSFFMRAEKMAELSNRCVGVCP